MNIEKLLIGLASVVVGWILAQFTSVAKDRLYARKIRKALLEELSELKSELDRTVMILSRQLQIHGLEGIDNVAPVPISNHIFSNYYKDAVLTLNKEQRISYQLINTLIGTLNDSLSNHKEHTESLQSQTMRVGKESLTKSDYRHWGEGVISLYEQANSTQWYIRYHLSRPENPGLLPYTKEHENYLKFLQKVNEKSKEIIENAKGLDKESFENVYNPEHFSK
ncbi:MAG: hypothetical protein B7X44_06845 [Halothiobacillus sp. 15-55-196]|jgi:hypothetical protein|uniref:hypothetical protein n=1 Tax=Halothiobacillus sp. 15-55-196 TaxID=1970382 RepID=UPI000BC59DE7|nr:hypothetical protein [Halothiobacillus sp. 15-55-196]OZB36239.1 MAG: hypothetical protein B7X44_06845 [Halothiobacillus sp. 15-55-196]